MAGVVAADRWIVDGNYGGTLDLRLAVADMVLFLDMPRRVTIPAILRRRLRSHGQAVRAPGCPERVSGSSCAGCGTTAATAGPRCWPPWPRTRGPRGW